MYRKKYYAIEKLYFENFVLYQLTPLQFILQSNSYNRQNATWVILRLSRASSKEEITTITKQDYSGT